MSQLRRRHKAKKGTLELTPLVDVALMLVVFLLLSSGMVAEEEQLIPVQLPAATQGDDAPAAPLNIRLTASGGLFHQGTALSLAEMETLVENAPLVVLHADKACTHGEVLRVVDGLRNAGVAKVFYATAPGPESW